jgi:hypothetical protein
VQSSRRTLRTVALDLPCHGASSLSRVLSEEVNSWRSSNERAEWGE